MYIHEVLQNPEITTGAAISRKCWINKAFVTRVVYPGMIPGLPTFLYSVPGTNALVAWEPSIEDLCAEDWFLAVPIMKNNERVGWRFWGLLESDWSNKL